MCIILIKQAGVKMPDTDTLKTCWQNNPDGAGYMFRKDDKVWIEKGFMFFEDFQAALSWEKIRKDQALVLHFRIGTSGSLNAGCTHPFPVSKSIKKLNATSIKCELGIAHNGIISDGTKKLSDSQLFVRDILSEPCVHDNLDSPAVQALIENYIGHSRLAFLDKTGKLRIFGEGWIEDEETGLIFSNEGYLPKSHLYASPFDCEYPDFETEAEMLAYEEKVEAYEDMLYNQGYDVPTYRRV